MTFQFRHFGRLEFFLTGTLVGLGVVAALTMTNIAFAAWNIRIFNGWTAWAIQYGYFGAFLTSLVGNVTVVIAFPYTLLVFFLATTGLNPILLGIATGLGAELGELTGYFLARLGAGAIERRKPKEYDALKQIVERRPRLVPALLFLFSITPLPDDVLFLPLGMLRYPVWKLAIPSLLGKVGAGLIIAFAGASFQTAFTAHDVRNAVAYQFGTLGLIAVLLYAVAKVPWHLVLGRLLRSHRT